MRNRFSPNLTPRNHRSSANASRNSSSTGNSSTSLSSSTPSSNSSGTQRREESQGTHENSVVSNISVSTSGEDAETEAQATKAQTKGDDKTSDKTKDNNPKVSKTISSQTKPTLINATTAISAVPGRRSRIKPSVTPVSTPRVSVRVKKQIAHDVPQETTCQQLDKVLSTSDDSITAGDNSPSLLESSGKTNDTVTTASATTRASKTESEPRSQPVATDMPFIPPRVTSKPSLLPTSDLEVTLTQTLETTVLTSSVSLTARRKRTLPNLGVAARRRRTSSVSKDAAEKVVMQQEVTVLQLPKENTRIHIPNESDEGLPERRKRRRTVSEEENTRQDTGSSEPACNTEEVPMEATSVHNIDEELEEQAKKRVEEKKKKHPKNPKPKEPLDPSKMTLQDLIYYNPRDNPMKSSLEAKKRKEGDKRKSSNGQPENNNMEVDVSEDTPASASTTGNAPLEQSTTDDPIDDVMAEEEDEESTKLAPQVKIAEDGTIILDEESLLIRSVVNKTMENSEIVYEDANEVNCAAYLKYRKVGRWSINETLKFYKALSQVGTDFSLMASVFPKRKRKELKAKFKREEKVHRDLVDKALQHRGPIDMEMFAPRVETEAEMDNLEANVTQSPRKSINTTTNTG